MLAARVKKPINKHKPIMINPQIFRKSIICKELLLLINQWKKPENSHFDCIRYDEDDQLGLNNLEIPSNRKCHPINIRNAVRSQTEAFFWLSVFINLGMNLIWFFMC